MSLKHKHFSKHWLWLVFPLVFLFLLTASLAIYHLAYAGRIFPGVAVGGIDVGGLTVNQAQDKLQAAWRNFMDKGVVVKYEKYQVTVPEILNASNQDLAVTVMGFSSATAAIEVYKVGRQGIWYNDLFIPLLARWLPKYGQAAAVVEVDIERIIKYIDHSLPNIQIMPQAASLALSEDGKPFIVPEKSGVLINQAGLAEELQTKLQTLTPTPVYLQVQPVLPALVTADLVNLLPVAQTLLVKNVNLIFTFEDKIWLIKPVAWRQWLQPIKESGEAKLIFETKLVKGALAEATAYVNQPAVNAKFELTDGRVQVFAASQEGREVDLSATLRSAVEQLSTADQDLSIPLIVKTTTPEVTTAMANNLGVTEIIGVGKSNFKGSPANRRHNIKVGADKLNGVIIQPAEEFSLIKTLGAIDASAGYLPELVIKGNKTVPEFGGGLCQIGTTTFRAALNSGLPILERRNHSYRVPYYEPAGTDATIYDPKPDFRFKNDTGRAILIQTKIKGDDLIFEFWGAKDGRVVDKIQPRIYNLVKPGPTKIIETTDLPVGEKKCTEKAHTGADAEFIYKVTYPTGEIKEQIFRSHYVPWQEVCLLGVAKVDKVVPDNSQPNNGSPPASLPSADITGQTGN